MFLLLGGAANKNAVLAMTEGGKEQKRKKEYKNMVIRLTALPLPNFPQGSTTQQAAASYPTRVTCLLHSGQLLHQQSLEVRVNEMIQEGVLEDDQTVFSWQLFTATDEIRITLLSKGTPIKHWRGCWNERDALLHTGTLPVHVIFNGRMQQIVDVPLAETMQPSEREKTNGYKELLMPPLGNSPATRDGTEREKTVKLASLRDLSVIAKANVASLGMQIGESARVEEEKKGQEWT